jgi:hypothetical protein
MSRRILGVSASANSRTITDRQCGKAASNHGF